MPDARIATGWGGRAADLLGGLNARSGVSMNVSLSGSNVFQAGFQTAEYAIETGAEGAPSVAGYGASDPFDGLQTRALDRILSGDYDNLLRAGYAQKLRGAIDAEARFSTALAGAPSLMTSFSANRVSAAFAQIARVIGARDALGARRQTFFLVFGGWDHHDEVIENQARMLAVVSKGLAEFSTALKELGVHEQVTTFTTSDFGRTLTSNGRGSDHGWGGHHMVMGGAVQAAAPMAHIRICLRRVRLRSSAASSFRRCRPTRTLRNCRVGSESAMEIFRRSCRTCVASLHPAPESDRLPRTILRAGMKKGAEAPFFRSFMAAPWVSRRWPLSMVSAAVPAATVRVPPWRRVRA